MIYVLDKSNFYNGNYFNYSLQEFMLTTKIKFIVFIASCVLLYRNVIGEGLTYK